MSSSPDLYRILRPVACGLAHVTARVQVEGVEHIPATGPFLLLSNHQSALDPIFVQGWAGREIHAMTKSTQFRHRLFRWLIPRLHGFPTRRYRVDPQAVRVALRRLQEGKGVSIYAEGERTWDGRVHSFRRGTVRLALRAGVPIVPCGISGSFDVWPRWGRRPRRSPVLIRYGPAIQWEPHLHRSQREMRLPDAAEELEDAVRNLVDEPAHAGDEVDAVLGKVNRASPDSTDGRGSTRGTHG